MLAVLAAVLLALWFLGLAVDVAGDLIHILLVAALVAVLAQRATGRRTA